MKLKEAQRAIQKAVQEKQLLVCTAECYVEYKGRAASKLMKGKRLLIIKGDGSIAIHQNKHVRPTNYMMTPTVGITLNNKTLSIQATKQKPKEQLYIEIYAIEFLHASDMFESNDLRLTGSEKELSDALMQDLSFIEKGLTPLKQESVLRKGVIDILAEDAKGKLVVIEVKRRMADFTAVTQLERYMKQVRKIKNKDTRGLLIAPGIRKNAKEMLAQLGLEYYQFNFEIDAAQSSSSIKGHESKQMKLL